MSSKEIETLAKEVRNEYFRNWRANNKDKVKKAQQDYWKRKAIESITKDGDPIAK